jgi:hypothetical protein
VTQGDPRHPRKPARNAGDDDQSPARGQTALCDARLRARPAQARTHLRPLRNARLAQTPRQNHRRTERTRTFAPEQAALRRASAIFFTDLRLMVPVGQSILPVT